MRFSSVEVGADTVVACEVEARGEVSDEDIGLVDEVGVKDVGEGSAIEEGDDVRVYAEEEGEGRGEVGTEDGALVQFHPLPEEGLGTLEPEVV